MAVVLPVLFALRRTRLWIPWLLAASYTFYGWWNPYYLILVFYSTLLDFILVALMDHCPLEAHSLAEMGLRVFGHQFDQSMVNCHDTRLEVPFSKNNTKVIKKKLEALTPMGITPIALSLQKAS